MELMDCASYKMPLSSYGGTVGIQPHLRKGACTYDIRKILGFLDPLPPCPNFALTYSIEFTQPPLVRLLLAQPSLPPQCGCHMYIAPKERSRLSEGIAHARARDKERW